MIDSRRESPRRRQFPTDARDGRQPRREEFVARLERQDREIERLRNTIRGVAREVGELSVNGRCEQCGRSYLLITDGRIYCPNCMGGQTL